MKEMTEEEIEAVAQAKVDAIDSERLKAFLNSLDEENAETIATPVTKPQMRDLVSIAHELAQKGFTAVMVPTVDASTYEGRVRACVNSYVARNADVDAAEVEKAAMAALHGEAMRKAEARITEAMTRAAERFAAEPEPFAVARVRLDLARREADARNVSREPVDVLPLVGALLKIEATMTMLIKVKHARGKNKTLKLVVEHPIAREKALLINDLFTFLLAQAALAHELEATEALAFWKRAIDFAWVHARLNGEGAYTPNGAARAWKEPEIRQLFELIDTARAETHTTCLIAAYAQAKEKDEVNA